jgi:hypothetical protein
VGGSGPSEEDTYADIEAVFDWGKRNAVFNDPAKQVSPRAVSPSSTSSSSSSPGP